jgi:ferredoxin-NADP reductase
LLLFEEMLLRQHAMVTGFHLVLFAEAGGEKLARRMAGLPKPPVCLEGRIALEALWSRLPEASNKVFYLSGPPTMLKTLSANLAAFGVPPARIRTDAWE